MYRSIVAAGRSVVTTWLLLSPALSFAQLTPNQTSLAAYLQKACAGLDGQAAAGGLSAAQQDLLARCPFFQNPANTAAALGPAYTQILGQQINALGPQTKKFGSLQQDNLSARLAELRHGVGAASLSGLNILTEDGTPLSAGASQIDPYLPVGSSGDGEGEWLDGRLGIFINGSLQTGSKKQTKNSSAFKIKDDSITIGSDYRINSHVVVGAAYGTGLTTTDFGSLGRLDLRAQGVNLYGSVYGSTYYVDLLAGYGIPRLETDRHITYSDTTTGALIDQDARATTHLHELWAGISGGRPFNWGSFGLTPEGSLNFHEVRLSKFSETLSDPTGPGAGFGLTYGDAVVPSLQFRAGLRAAYTLSTGWGVFEPNLHADWVREFRNHSDVFNAQLQAAPAGDLDSITIKTDTPEGHYTAYGAGLIFQLAHAVSGFVEYEELRTLKSIKSHEISIGVRVQVGL